MQNGSLAPLRGFPGNVTREELERASQRRLVVVLDNLPPDVVVTDAEDELYIHFSLAPPDTTTPNTSTEIRPGVFTAEADFWVAWAALKFHWSKTGAGNPDWIVKVKFGEDLGLPGETINGEVTADVLGSGGVDEFDAVIGNQLDFGAETIPPQELALFLAIPPGAADQSVTGITGEGWMACNGVPPL